MADRPGVAWAEPNFLAQLEMYAYTVPNDTLFSWQQGLRNTGQNGGVVDADVRAAQAWDLLTGNQRLVIASIDSGVDTSHPDLEIFRNDAEWGNGRQSNGVDNDGNGYNDDYRGWDFKGNDNDPNPGTSSGAAHGTACAGVAAAIGNNGAGVSGATWRARVLPIRVCDLGNDFVTADALGQSIRYAAQFADVISCSWGFAPGSSAINSAIDYATVAGRQGRGCPVFFASGNEATWWQVKPRRIACTIQTSGYYRFGIKAYASSSPNRMAQLQFDQVRVLGADGYTHLWHDDLESGGTGWSLVHGDGMPEDWWLTPTLQTLPQYWSGSATSFISPDFSGRNVGSWAEARTPAIWLPQGSCLFSFVWRPHFENSGPLKGQISLQNMNGQPVQTLEDASWPRAQEYGGVAYPANYQNSLAVGACTDFGMRAFYSRYSIEYNGVRELFCVAPSSGGWNMVVTTDTRGSPGAAGGDYRLDFGGTSAATPLTAGVAALVLSKNANLSRDQLKTALRAGCDRIGGVTYSGDPPWHAEYGYGRINADSSVGLAASDTQPPAVLSVLARTGRAVEVTFSEPMGSGVTSASLYTIGGSGKGTLASQPASVTWVSGNTFLLEWTAGEMIAGTGNISITVSTSVKDIAGNAMGSSRSGVTNGSRVIHAVSCGQPKPSTPWAPFDSDRYWSGVGSPMFGYTVNAFQNDDGTPDGVLISHRMALGSTAPGDIVYTLPGISAGVNHEVRLYFYNDGTFLDAGDMKFDIYINNVLKYSNLDLVLESGGYYSAFWKSFTNIGASGGAITVRIVPKLTWNQTWQMNLYAATISGVKVTAQ